MTDLYLVTGFLGAGKTTFLKGRLGSAASPAGSAALASAAGNGAGRRSGVLVNDFGKINFDDLQLRRDGLEMVALSNGSIFCSCLKESFIDGLVALLRRGLDEILIESSGLADPSEMDRILELVRMKALNAPFRYRGTVCLVDAINFLPALPKMLCVERQVRHSHLLIINKCDLADAALLQEVRATLARLNPQARIIETIQGQADLDLLGDDVFSIECETTTNNIATRNKNLIIHFIYDPGLPALRAFLDAMGDHFYRIKGLVRADGQLQQVDLVNRQVRLMPLPEPTEPAGLAGAGQLVCLTAQGLESISHLARMADRLIPGLFRLEL